MSRERVLALLRERPGEYLSGEAMSRTLGISRAGVWKAIEGLRQEGYTIASAPNRGYRLEDAPDRLRVGELFGLLSDARVGSQLMCLDVVDSTNTECKRQAMSGAQEGLVVTAEEQTGGRGRRGRGFQSPKGKGLYLSALFRPDLEPGQVSDFTAWVAVAVCDGIEACCGIRPQIKWTNDIILNGKKLVGILTELSLVSETNTLDYMVTGIGVNVNQAVEDFSPEIQEMATSLSMVLGRPVRRADLAAQIILALDRMYAGYPEDRAEYLKKYRAGCITTGHQVQLITPAARRQAFALEIDDDFNLVVELYNGKRETISAGEVSVRGMYGYV
ncbi:MAG: biotin--[acetyl-CoA-carboxylase] ligase [Lawsonibacter sp.]|jgi:BirA family biotin operon repressor/biotin-[acetyl-CoA-carboxylase] ligase|nr:biotin--[acetyl-CoA-carboxylase] ligase [Lawsonibacter sp.]